MIKNNVQIKDRLTDSELSIFAKDLAELSFVMSEDGVKTYAPYMEHIGMKTMFFTYCVDGLMFETDSDGEMENILLAIESDDELETLYRDYVNGTYDGKEICKQIKDIMPLVEKTIEYEKERLLRMQSNGLDYLFLSLGNIINDIGKDGLPDLIARAYEKLTPPVSKTNKKVS